MDKFQILSDKYTIPTLPSVRVQRRELMNIFQQEKDKRVIFVSAPAGYGKTISTLLWLDYSEYIPIWIGLDTYDNTPAIFYQLLCAGILSVQPDNKEMADILKSPSFASSPVEHTIRLLAEFVPDKKKYALVLDDTHLITNEELIKSLLLVQKRLPKSFVTLVLTRNVIAEEYIEIIGREKVAVITAEKLAFSSKEIQTYFSECGRPITNDEAVAVHDHTHGWAIGIQSLAMSGQIEPVQSNVQVLENYIKRTLWEQLDEDLQIFLLKTAMVDELYPELCDKLTGRGDSRNVLEKLRDSNTFTRKKSERTYQYHHLFQTFLRAQLEQDNSIDPHELYRQTAEWFFEQGDYFRATNYYIKLGNQEGITECLMKLRNYNLHNNIEPLLVFTKEYILGKLPDEFISENFEMTSRCAATYFWDGNSKQFCHYMDILYDNMEAFVKMNPKHLETISFLGGIDFRVPIHIFAEKFAEKLPVKSLLAKQESKRARVTTLTQNLPLMHRSMRDYSEIVIDTEKRMPMLESTFGLVIGKEYYVLAECIQAGLNYEKNLLPTALAHGISALEKCEENFGIEVKFCVYMILTTILSAMGRVKEVVSKTEAMESFIETESAQYLYPNLLACTVKTKLWRGDQVIAKEWLEQYFITKKTHLELYQIYQYFTTARAYLVLEETDLAMEYILKLKQLGTDYQRPLDIAEAGVLQAVLEWALGHKKEAQDILEEVLGSMQEYRFTRVVANEGASVLPILRKLALKLKKESYSGRLDAHFLQEVTIAAYEQSKRYKGITANIENKKPVKLSKQQKHMITLLSKGYKNAEIVEITGLTIHTVKSHCAVAYRKLGVHNAMDAVIKARELGLIE